MSPDLEAERLLAAARRAADPVTAARLTAEAFFTLSRTADPATLAPLAERLSALRSDPPRPQTEVLYHTVTGVVGVRTRRPYATRHLEAVLRLVEQHGLHTDPLHLECALLSTIQLIRPHEARPRYAQHVAQADAEPARRARLTAMLGLGDAWAGDVRRGQAVMREALRLARAADLIDVQAEAASFLVKIEALAGDLTAAEQRLAEARELAARAGSAWVAVHIAECASVLHLATGDTEAWLGVLEFLVATVVGANSGLIFEHRFELATHHALHGRPDAAAALLAGLPDPPLAWPGAPALPAWRAWIARPADPAAMAQFEASLAGLNRPAERLSRARMAWLLGAQHARLGRRADAIRLLEVACTGYAATGAVGLHTRALAELCAVSARFPAAGFAAGGPHTGGTGGSLTGGSVTGGSVAGGVGTDDPVMGGVATQGFAAQGFVAGGLAAGGLATGGVPAGPGGAVGAHGSAAAPAVAALTAAEARVAGAVAGGLSNREVAELLGVSAKTVEFHLGNIFRKLGVRNRTQLAAAAPVASRAADGR